MLFKYFVIQRFQEAWTPGPGTRRGPGPSIFMIALHDLNRYSGHMSTAFRSSARSLVFRGGARVSADALGMTTTGTGTTTRLPRGPGPS